MAGKKQAKKKQQEASQNSKEKENTPSDSLSEFKNEIKVGVDSFIRDDFVGAYEHFTTALNSCPNDSNLQSILYTNKSICLIKSKEFQKAIEESENAISFNSQLVRGWMCGAFGKFYLQKYKEAINECDQAEKITNDQNIKNNIQKVRDLMLAQWKKIKESLLIASNPKAFRELALETINDYGFLNLEEEFLLSYLLPSANQINRIVNDDDDEPPYLIPTGEFLYDVSWDENSVSTMTKEQREQAATEEKKVGNKAVENKEYISALGHYTKAIKLNGSDSVFYSNRALVYLKLSRFHEALTDCTISISLQPNLKAYLRRAASYNALGKYFNAINDYKAALRFEDQQEAHNGLVKALTSSEEELKLQLQHDAHNDSLKAKLKAIRDELKEYAIKTEKTEKPEKVRMSNKPTVFPVEIPLPGHAHFTAHLHAFSHSHSHHFHQHTHSHKNKKSAYEMHEANIERFSKILDNDSVNLPAIIGRADTYVQIEEFDLAIADYKYALKLDPDNSDFHKKWKSAIKLKEEDS